MNHHSIFCLFLGQDICGRTPVTTSRLLCILFWLLICDLFQLREPMPLGNILISSPTLPRISSQFLWTNLDVLRREFRHVSNASRRRPRNTHPTTSATYIIFFTFQGHRAVQISLRPIPILGCHGNIDLSPQPHVLLDFRTLQCQVVVSGAAHAVSLGISGGDHA